MESVISTKIVAQRRAEMRTWLHYSAAHSLSVHLHRFLHFFGEKRKQWRLTIAKSKLHCSLRFQANARGIRRHSSSRSNFTCRHWLTWTSCVTRVEERQVQQA